MSDLNIGVHSRWLVVLGRNSVWRFIGLERVLGNGVKKRRLGSDTEYFNRSSAC